MYFKAIFSEPVQEESSILSQTELSNLTGNETLTYNNYEFEIERDSDNTISGITFCNQCVNTFGIEAEFLKLISEILPSKSTVKLYDSNGLTEIFSSDDLEEYIS